MKIAVASGKGGTGKTTVSLALAASLAGPVTLLDCDVEEPNCHLFLKPRSVDETPVLLRVPLLDEEKCTACGKCGELCQFNAIVSLQTKALLFPELCHACGGCVKVCPTGALTERDEQVGVVYAAKMDSLDFVWGAMDVGRSLAPPVIRAVRQRENRDGVTLLDCPPGTACAFVTAVSGCDFAILVTEPTPFGLHDLKLAVDTVRELGVPFGVVINHADSGDHRVREYCSQEKIPLLLEIPEERRVAEAYARGETLVSALPNMEKALSQMPQRIQTLVG